MDLHELRRIATERGASDIHIKVGRQPVLRVNGELIPMLEKKRLMQEDTTGMAFDIMNDYQKEKFKRNNEIDLAYSVPGLGRFRVNIFRQRGTVGLVFRVIPMRIRNIQELHLPKILDKISMEERGLILCTGTTGSGKSTTLAAMIDLINQNRTVHVMTIEDPIEYLHRDKKSLINQRELGSDTFSFSDALRAALRQDPDVILVGEMRDFATIETALAAAETGHLVYSTLHTMDSIETIQRIIAFYPPHQQQQIRLQLASVLKAVISQRLIPRADEKGRVPAVEVLRATALIRDCIIDPLKTSSIKDAIEQGVSQYGMQSFDQSLRMLVKNGLVTYQEAIRRCSNPDDFALKFKGITTTSDMAMEDMEAVLQDDSPLSRPARSSDSDEDDKPEFDFSNQFDTIE
ncbi:type IV pilus twitching motility protein PilT [bacterium]|nr:type IV pilus twitching motility protein PilT [candidate division CSSED10-310 bacterium]